MKKVRRLKSVAVLAVAAVALSACGGDDVQDAGAEQPTSGGTTAGTDDAASDAEGASSVEAVMEELGAMEYEERIALIEEKAHEEGAVLLYGSSNIELQEEAAEAFNEKYPDINMLYVRSKSEDIGQRLEAEARAGRHLVDVIAVNAVVGASLFNEGLIANHFGAPIPPGIPDRYVGEWGATQYISPNVITWNTDLVSEEEAPRSLDELLDPKWKGKVALDVGANNFIAGLVHERGEEGAREYLTKLVVDNDALIRSGHTNITELMAAGEFPVAVELYAYKVEGLIVDDGAPLAWHAPDPTAANATGVYIYKHTTRPHAAALLMHHMLSKEGAQVVADTGRISVNTQAELAYPKLQPFIVEGTPEFDILLPISPEIGLEVEESVQRLIDEVVSPRFSE